MIPILLLLGVSATATAAFSGIMVVTADLMLMMNAVFAKQDGIALLKKDVLVRLRR